MSTLFIDERFCGPPDTGNGGYVCGRLAVEMEAPVVEVTLRRPIPLARNLDVRTAQDAHVVLCDGDAVLAEAKPQDSLDVETPPIPTYQEAVRAVPRYLGFRYHSSSNCFVCGPGREQGNGLNIFAGPLDGQEHLVAAPWIPEASLADQCGQVRPEFIWAALDCPGAFAIMGQKPKSMVLGRMTTRIDAGVRAGEVCVVFAWRLTSDGRKQFAGSALVNGTGRIVGIAKTVWFDVPASAV